MAEPDRLEESLRPDVSHLVMEDDEPVDNWFQERQQKLLPDALYASWDRPFLAASDVGLFYKVSEPPVVPDVLVSLGVTVPESWWEDENRCYLTWVLGKAPEIALEIVSNRRGGEEEKLLRYAAAGVRYCSIYDPRGYLSKRPLRVFELHAGSYVELLDPSWLDGLGAGLCLWEGTYEGLSGIYLRWCDRQRCLIPTSGELASREKQRADRESQRADRESQRADRESQRADRLAARLRELGQSE